MITTEPSPSTAASSPLSWFDAHCHLQDERLAPRLTAVMEHAGAAGVRAFMCCGTCESDWPRASAIANRYAGVRISFGLHPWYVADRSQAWLDTLRNHVVTRHASIGEIGLDHALDPATFDDQEEVFLAQITLASELERPVSLHCRRAWGRLMELLDGHGWPPAGVILHSYSGGPGLVNALARRGAWFSFSGSITHDKNLRGREAVVLVPEDRILLETDSPDIMPALPEASHHIHLFHQKPVNEPANLVAIGAAVAALRQWTPDQTAAITRQNAEKAFAL